MTYQSTTPYSQIIDANLNRVAEGLRVIEDYCRFVAQHKPFTDQLAALRKQIKSQFFDDRSLLLGRDTAVDQRALEPPPKRADLYHILRANFSRVTEALRVLEEYTDDTLYNAVRYTCYDLEKAIALTALKPNIGRGIYLISDNPDRLIEGCEAGVQFIQLRDKSASKSVIYEKALAVKRRLPATHPPFIINDHIDIARAVDADGLHTGQDDLPISVIRHQLGPHKLIGRTTHTLEQGLVAQHDGADYISVGPIFETPSKPGRPGIGLSYLSQVNDHLRIPYVVIGGLNRTTIHDVLPFHPPLIGVIRAGDDLDALMAEMVSYSS